MALNDGSLKNRHGFFLINILFYSTPLLWCHYVAIFFTLVGT